MSQVERVKPSHACVALFDYHYVEATESFLRDRHGVVRAYANRAAAMLAIRVPCIHPSEKDAGGVSLPKALRSAHKIRFTACPFLGSPHDSALQAAPACVWTFEERGTGKIVTAIGGDFLVVEVVPIFRILCAASVRGLYAAGYCLVPE